MVQFYTTPHCICHFFWRDGSIVQFLQLWDVPDDSLPVPIKKPKLAILLILINTQVHLHFCISLCTRVLLQPQVPQAGQVPQPADLTDVRDPVLPDVELLQVLTELDVCQGGDIVDTINEILMAYSLVYSNIIKLTSRTEPQHFSTS